MGKNKKRSAFLPPLRNPQGSVSDMMLMKKIQASYHKEMTEASNNAFNLATSAALIAARDMGMGVEEVKEFLQRTFGILDDVADDLSRIEEMLKLVGSWGIEIFDTAAKRTVSSGEVIEKKTSVFYLLQTGVTEIEEIITKCKLHNIEIDYREACAYRWEFNRIKYYEDMEADMSRKEEAFTLLDQGLQNTDLVEKMGISRNAASQYRYQWNREQEGDTMGKNKTRAFNMIGRGASKEELVNELGITEAAAIRFLDKCNEEKNGGEIEVMTESMKRAFDLFDKALSEAQVVKELGISKANAANYKAEWIRINKRDLSTDEMSDILAGDDESIVILKHKGVLPKDGAKDEVKAKAKKHYEPSKAREVAKEAGEAEGSEPKEEGTGTVEVIEQDTLKKNGIASNPKFEAAVKAMEEQHDHNQVIEGKKGLRKVVKVIEVQGDFTTYKPVGSNSFDMEIDGQVITLSREQMKDFGEELLAVAEEEI